MKRSVPPALAGFWLGYLITTALLFGWAMLGLWLYFLDSSELWYDVTGFLLALLPLLMAGGLTRKLRPGLRAKGLWAAAGLDALVLLGFYVLGGDAHWFCTLPGEVLASWVPPLAERLGVGAYYARMMLRDGVGILLRPLAFTLGCLLARRPEESADRSPKGEEGAEWTGD